MAGHQPGSAAKLLFVPLASSKFQSNVKRLKECDSVQLSAFLKEIAMILLGEPDRTACTAFVGGRLSRRNRKFLCWLNMTLAGALRCYANDFFFEESANSGGRIHVTYLHITLRKKWQMSLAIAI
eukprot:TRINITY_DN42264_c0_g2_i1.p1 TRINITY_DN42264_c0_g2~~TRINITY_DN42264_c0_g2_i1.p1  ORF type:complete len:133 (-),score=19.87 TRINITY_DN42264_c0_g2_i1:60-434(-)